MEQVDPVVVALYRNAGEGDELKPEYRLTDKGRQVGRMLVASAEPPPEIAALLERRQAGDAN